MSGALGTHERVVDRIDRNIDRCTRIIEELLNFTRTTQPVLRTVALDDWVAAQLEDYEMPADFELALRRDSTARVDIDTDQLRQAVVDLIQNACRSMLAMESPRDRFELEVHPGMRDGCAVMEVRDNGPGLDPTLAERIFEPLVTSRSFGVGLGLPLVRRIARQLGGDVTVGHSDEEGCTFVLTLPVGE